MAVYDTDYQALRQKEIEEYKLKQQLKIKKMIKVIGASVIGFFLLVVLFNSCERVDAGHVGVKVNMYGDNKGVDDVVAGRIFKNSSVRCIQISN
jgi:hypothetical protein